MDFKECAQLALLGQYVFDMTTARGAGLTPPLDPRFGVEWKLIGWLDAYEATFKLGPLSLGERVCYGVLLESALNPGHFILFIRGTATLIEWGQDAEFLPVEVSGLPGTVEDGFRRVYGSLRFAPAGVGAAVSPAYAGVAAAVSGGRIVVVGHSLGSALGTYMAYDLAGLLGGQVSARLIASPRPGNAAFGAAFDARVADYAVINAVGDVVPRVPAGPDYAHLPRVTWLDASNAQAEVKEWWTCQHHLLSYAARMNYMAADWEHLGEIDSTLTGCILGPGASA